MIRQLHAAALFTTALCLWIASATAQAQNLPVRVSVSGNHATASIGLPHSPAAEFSIAFDDATGLTAASLGLSARTVSLGDAALLARLPDADLTQLSASFPVLISVAPPSNGGLSFNRTWNAEIHTHLLPYTAGSLLRVFKAEPGGVFRDITHDIQPGSVRARSSGGHFSEFLILTDLRSTASVIDGKFSHLRDFIAPLDAADRDVLDALADGAELAVAEERFADAIAQLDQLRAEVSARAGSSIDQQWRAQRDLVNAAGELLATANSLKFSIGFLRDYGL